MSRSMNSPHQDSWAEGPEQESFDDLLFAEERAQWAQQRRCFHCYVWGYNENEDMFYIACAHGCGSVRHKWHSPDPKGDMKRVKATREAYMIAHAHGCPRDSNRNQGKQGGSRFGKRAPR